MWKRYFPIGGGIILLLGAPVKSKFDGLKSRKHRFPWFMDFWSPWERLSVSLSINYFKKLWQSPKQLWKQYYSRKFGNVGRRFVGNVGKDGHRQIPHIRLMHSLEDGINIFQKAWNGNLVILESWNLGMLTSWNFETLKFWNFEILERGNEERKICWEIANTYL